MKIADLFVDLGVTGSEKSVGAIAGMRRGMGDLSSVSLEAKAAIVGAMYALQRMFATSGQAGTSLTQFSHLIDTNTKTLQEYQYAAQQVGVSNEEMANTFLALQEKMTDTLRGKGAPEGVARIAQKTFEEFGDFNPLDYQKDTAGLIQRLQAYAQKETNTGLMRTNLKSFGLSDAMIAALSQNAFRPDVFKRAPTYSEKEIQSLAKADAAWKNLGTSIEMAFGRFNAKHGQELVADIDKIVKSVLKLAESFVQFSEKVGLFEKLTKVFEGWKMIFDLISQTIKDVNALEKPEDAVDYFLPEQAKAAGTGPQSHMESQLLMIANAMVLAEKMKTSDFYKDKLIKLGNNYGTAPFSQRVFDYLWNKDDKSTVRKVIFGNDPNMKPNPQVITPTPGGQTPSSNQQTINNQSINQTLNFNGNGVDGNQAADAHKKAAKDFTLTSPARGWGN